VQQREIQVVTGAFGFIGRYVARRLLAAGVAVRTLTNSPKRAPPSCDAVEVHDYSFDDPPRLVAALRGARVLYNTYWVRFNYRAFRHADAVANTLTLFEAARVAGVERVVHISITNPSEDSPLEYFRGKARLEHTLRESGLSYAILRPAVVFGREDILINNIAWMLRRVPVFGVFGDGAYRLQPIYADDLAALAVARGQQREDCVIDAVGPETLTYRELVGEIGRRIGCPRPMVPVSPRVGLWIARLLGLVVRDVVLTRDEIEGLMADLLCTGSSPAGTTRLTEWVSQNAATIGRRYASELARRRDRRRGYQEL
jgi:NADH dehydrogenase